MLKGLSGFASFLASFASPPPIGSTTPNTGAFTTLTATSETVGTAAVAVTIAGNTTGLPASVTASGTDTNIVGVGVGPKGTGAFQLQITDSGTGGGNARGNNAVDLQTLRSAANQVASGPNAFLAGTSSTASGTGSIALGSTVVSSGTGSLAAGTSNTASGDRGATFGYLAIDRGRYGSMVYANGQRVAPGDAQAVVATLLRGSTTDAATGVRLTSDGAAAGSANVVNLANSTSLRFRILLVAQQTNTAAKEWVIEGLALRSTTAASTSFPTAAGITTTYGSAGLATCAVTCTADTTNGGINLTVNGVIATNIRWVAFVQAVEVG